jgi:hypothetical protein
MESLVLLLERVATESPIAEREEPDQLVCERAALRNSGFDPSLVSESLWEEWRSTVRRHGLERELLGRLAPSLRALPTVTWHVPLGDYLGQSVADIRRMKTHGEKRVRAVLEVFHTIHELLGQLERNRHFEVRITPRFLAPLELWIGDVLRRTSIPDLQEMRQSLVLPLLNQVELDAGETVHHLAAGRLGIESPGESVREQAKRLELTRVRVYQLLEMCARVMQIRWPEGRWQLEALAAKCASLPPRDERFRLIRDVRTLMFARRSRVAGKEPAMAESVT